MLKKNGVVLAIMYQSMEVICGNYTETTDMTAVYGWLHAEKLVRGLGVFVEGDHIITHKALLHKDNCNTTTKSLNYQHT